MRVWSARLKGELLLNLVAFKKAVFKDVGGFLKSRFKICFLVCCHLMLEVTFQFGLNTRGVNSNTCHFCLDLYYIFHECQVYFSTLVHVENVARLIARNNAWQFPKPFVHIHLVDTSTFTTYLGTVNVVSDLESAQPSI